MKNTKQVPAKKTFSQQKAAKPVSSSNGSAIERNFCGGGWNHTKEHGLFAVLSLDIAQLNEFSVDSYGKVKVCVAQKRQADERSGQDLMVYESEAKK